MIIGKIIYNEEEGAILWDEKFLEECKGISRLDVYLDVLTDVEKEYNWYLERWHRDYSVQRKKIRDLRKEQDKGK